MQCCENCGTNRKFCEKNNRKNFGVCGNWSIKDSVETDKVKAILKEIIFDTQYHLEGISDTQEIAWLEKFVIDKARKVLG